MEYGREEPCERTETPIPGFHRPSSYDKDLDLCWVEREGGGGGQTPQGLHSTIELGPDIKSHNKKSTALLLFQLLGSTERSSHPRIVINWLAPFLSWAYKPILHSPLLISLLETRRKKIDTRRWYVETKILERDRRFSAIRSKGGSSVWYHETDKAQKNLPLTFHTILSFFFISSESLTKNCIPYWSNENY